MTRSLSALFFASTLAIPGVAQACGGFFCNSSTPVDQSAEEILFAVNKADSEITMHIKIMYEGPAEEFAWVVPVAGVPDIGIGSDAIFATLRQFGAQWNIERDTIGECGYDDLWDYDGGYYSASTASPAAESGVQIVSTQVVGPYETVVLMATDSAALAQWLVDNEYDIPPNFDPVLAPYVAEGQAFVALKLLKDKDTGDIAPLVLTYPGEKPTIPIQLTSVAATPDMRLRIHVLGEHRAVPESYLHVQLNHLAVDWWNFGNNYESVVARAADEAGGHAFATDYAGPPDQVLGQLWNDNWDAADLASATSAYDFLNKLIWGSYPADDSLLNVLNAHIPVPAGLPGVTDTQLYNCPDCYMDELIAMPFDAQAAADDVDLYVLGPRADAEQMFEDYPWISRLTSSVSPSEMTVDPVFVFNPDMAERPAQRTAWETLICLPDSDGSWDAPRRFAVEDGRVVKLPSSEQLSEWGMTELEYLVDLTVPAAAIIEQTSASGQPVILVDNTPDLQDHVDAFNGDDGDEKAGNCSCSTGSNGLVGTLPLLLAFGLIRRRES